MTILIAFFAILFLSQEPAQKQDAVAMEAQYKTCAKHYIPADKCTNDVYQQLKEKDSAPPDADTAFALGAVNEYRPHLNNPDSMQIRTAYIVLNGCKKCTPEDRTVCLEVTAQNGFGGMTTSHVARETIKGRTRWFYESDSGGSFPIHIDPWEGRCTNVATPFHPSTALKPGINVTEKVNQALKNAK
jgi:hypothetical protein